MARKKYKNRLTDLDDIKEKIKLIEGSQTDYVSETGKIYSEYGKNKFILKKCHVNEKNGYTYCGIHYKDRNKQRRVHVLVAKAFLDNPNGYKYVGHKHNNKSCTDAKELYWTTAEENTKRAYDDGLSTNAIGFDDSQSFGIKIYTKDGTFIEKMGSVCLTSKKYNVSKSTVLRHCRREIKTVRGIYTFRFLEDNF